PDGTQLFAGHTEPLIAHATTISANAAGIALLTDARNFAHSKIRSRCHERAPPSVDSSRVLAPRPSVCSVRAQCRSRAIARSGIHLQDPHDARVHSPRYPSAANRV